MTQYNRIKTFLLPLGYTITVSEETYYSNPEKDRQVQFQCNNNHNIDYDLNAYRTAKLKFIKKLKTDPSLVFCSECTRLSANNVRFGQYKEQVYNSSRHILLSYDTKTREANYQCGRCGKPSKTCLTNLLKSKGGCGKCETIPYRNTYTDVKQLCDEQKIKLQWTEEEYKANYKNNKQSIPFICVCGKSHSECLSDIRKGKKCQTCKVEKYKNTCLEKYGCENAFQDPEIKKKIKETFRVKYGVDHPLQNPDIFYKNRKSMFGKKEFTFPSGRKELVMGYEPLTLDFLLKNKNYLINRAIKEEEIVVGEQVPTFRYHDDKKKNILTFPIFM
jgi:hypothetical protein